jgi:HD-GYP domain-containing protein (c-di-GMP phosphodiesterase class II)
VSSVVEFLKSNPVSAALIKSTSTGQGYLAEHAGNVFYLSMVLGAAVRDYVMRERRRQTAASNLAPSLAMDLRPLGLGAMFLDVAMSAIEHVFAPDYELTDEDRRLIHHHPIAGAQMLPDTIPAATKMIVRGHHENYDGSGYPESRPGPSLHVFVRIVRICDAFDAATSQKFYRTPKSPARALWEMSAGPYRKFYDPVLMKVFLSIIQPFPIGSKLTLEDGRLAVVVKYNRKSPFFPTCVIAFDAKGNRLPPEQLLGPINIGEGNDFRIKSSADEDLSYLKELSPPHAQRALGDAFKDLLEMAYP